METCAVIVGASAYRQNEIFSPLPGAAKDAVWLERFLLSKGMSRDAVFAPKGISATKAAILDGIRSLGARRRSSPLRLLFFFSGHGGSLPTGAGHQEAVLFCYDTSIGNRLATSLSLSELLHAMSSIPQLDEAYLFLDACYMSLAGVAAQVARLATSGLQTQVFVCVIANDGGVSLEGVTSSLGEFSSSLLATISDLDKQESPSIASLVTEFPRRVKRGRLGKPVTLAIGDLSIWPFNFETAETIARRSDEVQRDDVVAKLVHALRSGTAVRVCLSGPSGSGKSVALRQASRQLPFSPVCAFSAADLSLTSDKVRRSIARAISIADPACAGPVSSARTLEERLALFQRNHPHPVLIIDGGENLRSEVWEELLPVLTERGVDLVCTRHTADLPGCKPIVIPMPALSWREAEELGRSIGVTDIDRLRVAFAGSDGYPLRFIQFLKTNAARGLPIELSRAASIVAESLGLCDAVLFAAVTKVPVKDLDRLRDLGLLIDREGHCVLHDEAIRAATVLEPADWRAIMSYWEAELEGRQRVVAAQKIIELAPSIPSHALRPSAVAGAIKIGEAQAHSRSLADAAMAASRGGECSALVAAIDALSRRGRADLMHEVLDHFASLNIIPEEAEDLFALRLAQARVSWWRGDYAACRAFAELAAACSTDDMGLRAAELEKAIAAFFLGEWDEAQTALEPIAEIGGAEFRTVGWAQLILGTCLSIRGVDVARGKSLLRSSIEILRASSDVAGVAIAKGNLGEVLWKDALYEQAEAELGEGLELALRIGMEVNALEARRNLIQLYMRWSGAWDARITEHLSFLSRSTAEGAGEMEMMQIANTLATLHIYRGELGQAETWIDVAAPFTDGNPEYEIYTKANRALLLALLDASGRAMTELRAACELCVSGQNLLALRQIRQDFSVCLALDNPGIYAQAQSLLDNAIRRVEP